MRTEKFKVIQFIRELLEMIDQDMDNFTKKDIELKNELRNKSYEMLETAYLANSMPDVKRKKEIIIKLIAKVKVVDFIINLSFDKEIITKKKYLKFGQKTDDIVRYATGWLESL